MEVQMRHVGLALALSVFTMFLSGCSNSTSDNMLVRIESNMSNTDSLKSIGSCLHKPKYCVKRKQLVAQAQQLPDSLRATVLAVCAKPREAANQMYERPSLNVIRLVRERYLALGYPEKAAEFEQQMELIFKNKTPKEQASFLSDIFTPQEIKRGIEESDSALRIELNIK